MKKSGAIKNRSAFTLCYLFILRCAAEARRLNKLICGRIIFIADTAQAALQFCFIAAQIVAKRIKV